ncbi:hypothetical protein QOZ80_4AG0312190 [Eleusine coracana subsp. coracana]|nr:hypothetical protein QOZ80_4AG0312190 [Eleusine coracana subsp. coracana]
MVVVRAAAFVTVVYAWLMGKFYLVDAGYACRPRFLPPYRATRRTEEVVHVDNDVEVVEAPVVAEQRGRGAMQWTSAMSGFVLCRMCELISTGVRTDKGFKEVHLNQVAKSLQEFTSNEVTSTQVYNHLRKWRQRWMRVSKLRELSGANWDEDLCMITLEEEHFKGHIKAHPKDVEYLNKPIENYKQMMTIFGTSLATGNSGLKTEPFDEEKVVKSVEEMAKAMGEASKEVTSAGPPPNKRRRTAITEEDSVVLCSMTEAVKDVAAAIRETKVEAFNPDLYGPVMYMPGFTEEALICAFSHLVDNKAQGDAFVQLTKPHRVLWLRTWLAKHYYL